MSFRILKGELEGLGCIDGDDNMIWKSPDNSYTFKISRSELDNLNPIMPRYLISIIVENTIGTKVLELRFNELDAVRILDNIEEFCGGDVYYQKGENFIIPVSTTDTSLNSYTIYLENIFEDNYIAGNGKEIYRDILFKIKQYNPIENITIDRVTIVLGYEDICDLAFKLFFEAIIDIDFPDSMNLFDTLNRIDEYVSMGPNACRMTDYNPPTYHWNGNNNFMNPPTEAPNTITPVNIPTPKVINNRIGERVSFTKHNKEVNKV